MIETYKFLSEKYDTELECPIKLRSEIDIANTARGHNKKIFRQQWRKNIRGKFFTVRTAETWNTLPEEIIDAPSTDTFKARIDKWWRNEPILYDYKAQKPASLR